MFRLAEETIFQRASERNSRFCRNLLKVGMLGAIGKLMLALNLRYGANTPLPPHQVSNPEFSGNPLSWPGVPQIGSERKRKIVNGEEDKLRMCFG